MKGSPLAISHCYSEKWKSQRFNPTAKAQEVVLKMYSKGQQSLVVLGASRQLQTYHYVCVGCVCVHKCGAPGVGGERQRSGSPLGEVSVFGPFHLLL